MFERTLIVAFLVPAAILCMLSVQAQDVDKNVLEAQAKRVAVIAKVTPSVVAIFARGGQGGGSGVLVTKDGFALTNFHVVEDAGPIMKCGLPDGVLYDAILVGLDKVGDVALIKLLPKEKGKDFPFSVMGDSDKVKAGDWSMALGNPFLLATDFQPTVTFGLVSGIHRYQYPAGTLLEYTDCIQIDTSINPGNSGGPLYDMSGTLIGINGRGSFEKRGRVNSGAGYAISINQIKNFLGQLMAGIDTDHATLGAEIKSESEELTGNPTVATVLTDTDVFRRGLEPDDELVSFAGRSILSVNQYKNVLGLYPKGWRIPMVYRRKNDKREILVRLMQLRQSEQHDQKQPQPRREPKPRPEPGAERPAAVNPELAKLYEPRPGFSNYYFNKIARDRLFDEFRKHGDFTKATGSWNIDADADVRQKKSHVKVFIGDNEEKDGKPLVRKWTYHLQPELLKGLPEGDAQEEQNPLRKAVLTAADMLRKHATSFPQEVWAKETDAATKEYVRELRNTTESSRKELLAALDDLKKAGKERDKEESRTKQAQYDFTLARLTAFCAHAHEYDALLGQLLGNDPPKRDPKVHRSWRMMPEEKIQNADASRLNGEAVSIWRKILKEYKDSVWEDRATDGIPRKIGLRWQPSGGARTLVKYETSITIELDPLKLPQDLQNLKEPLGSGGLMTALYQYRHFLTSGPAGFEGYCHHGGAEPIYPPPLDGKKPKSLADLRVDTEVLLTEHAAVPVKWYFSPKDHTLLAFEAFVDRDDDPCEVYLSDYRMVDGRSLPYRFDVRHGNDLFGSFLVKDFRLK